MSFLIAVETISIPSPRSAEDVIASLREIVDVPGYERPFQSVMVSPARQFKGTVTANAFCLERSINYSNFFLPSITGTVVETPTGSEIKVRYRMSGLAWICWIVWLVASFGTLAVLLVYDRNSDAISVTGLMAAVSYVVPVIAYSAESRIATRMLTAVATGELATEELTSY